MTAPTSQPLRVFLVAMEHSGDIYGAQLVRALRARVGDADDDGARVEAEGLGGSEMAAAGVNLHEDTVSRSLVGFVEVIRHVPRLIKLGRRMIDRIVATRPDAVVVIDSPDFNFPLVRMLRKRLGARAPLVVYCICPQIWAWRTGRMRRMRSDFDLRLVIFPFEPAWYRSHACDALYIGHPLVGRLDDVRRHHAGAAVAAGFGTYRDDILDTRVPTEPMRRHVRRRLGIADDEVVIGLLPGSRGTEIRHILPTMIRAAWRLWRNPGPHVELAPPGHPPGAHLRFVVSAAPGRDSAYYAPYLATAPPGTLLLHPDAPAFEAQSPREAEATARQGSSYSVMIASDLAVIASGTATVEAALLDTPMIVVYRGNDVSALIARELIDVPFAAMPNLIARRRIVPELLQWSLKPRYLAQAVRDYLDPTTIATQRDALAKVRDQIGTAPAMEHAADAILEALIASTAAVE